MWNRFADLPSSGIPFSPPSLLFFGWHALVTSKSFSGHCPSVSATPSVPPDARGTRSPSIVHVMLAPSSSPSRFSDSSPTPPGDRHKRQNESSLSMTPKNLMETFRRPPFFFFSRGRFSRFVRVPVPSPIAFFFLTPIKFWYRAMSLGSFSRFACLDLQATLSLVIIRAGADYSGT